MSRIDSPLNNIKIASPCSADWNAMAGDDRKRSCGDCKMNVYNLSGMTKYDAENLLMNSEGRVCVRYFQRADGTILTQDCPVGWARVKRRLSAVTTAVIGLFVMITGGMALFTLFGRKSRVVMGEMTPVNIGRRIEPQNDNRATMGAIAMPLPKNADHPKQTELMGKIAINRN